jgi:hypothetical protein
MTDPTTDPSAQAREPEPGAAAAPPATPPPAPPSAAPSPPPPASPPPADAWRERERWRRVGDIGSLIWGLVLIAVGGWFFVEVTLDYDLPRIDWNIVWPVVLIAIGGWVVLRAMNRRAA